LSLITTSVGDYSLFSDINVSQGGAAVRMRYGGIFNNYVAANLLENLPLKKTLKIGKELTELRA